MFQVAVDGVILQSIEGAVHACRLSPGHSEVLADEVDAFRTVPAPLQKGIECLACKRVVLATPIDPPGLVCVESESNPLLKSVFALADPFSLVCVIAERVVSIAAQVALQPLLNDPDLELQRASMNTTILWHGSIPLKFIGQPVVARQEHLRRFTRIVQDRNPVRLPV